MTSEKFAKSVAKKLLCKPEKKKEILKQIQSDIEIALQSGKSLEEVLKEMGSPSMIAQEFNENFDDNEKKAVKKKKTGKIVAVIIAVFIALIAFIFYEMPKTYSIQGNKHFDESKIREQAELIINLIDENDVEGMKPYLADVMVNITTKEGIMDAKAHISKDFGEFQSYGNAYTYVIKQGSKEYAVIQIVACYDNTSVTYTFSFDPDMKLSGCYMK